MPLNILLCLAIRLAIANNYLFRDAFTVQLSDSGVAYVGCEVSQRRVLLGEHVKTGRLKGHVERGHNVTVCTQVITEMEFSIEILNGRIIFGQRFEHHLVIRPPVFDQ